MNNPIHILLVDESELVRYSVKNVLQSHDAPRLSVVGEAGGVAEAITQSILLKPDIVLIGIRLPDGSGFEACRQIMRQLPDTRVIMLTSYSNDNYVYEAVTSGAQGYLMKEIDPPGLIQGIIDVAAGRSIVDHDTISRVIRILRDGPGKSAPPADIFTLSLQEQRLLALVAEGKTNKEIGSRLVLSENTVKNYLVNVFTKLKVRRRSQAASLFVQQTDTAQKPPSSA